MGNSSQVLIKKKKKTLISLVTLSPLIYIFIHHKLGKLISDYVYTVFKAKERTESYKIPHLPAYSLINGCLFTKRIHAYKWRNIQCLAFVKPESSVIWAPLWRLHSSIQTAINHCFTGSTDMCALELANTFISSSTLTARRSCRNSVSCHVIQEVSDGGQGVANF